MKKGISIITKQKKINCKTPRLTLFLLFSLFMFQTTFAAADPLQSEQTYSFWFSFFVGAPILLREGLEAVLIIITILSLLKSLRANKAIRWVHSGWITALVIGIISWFFTGWLISLGSQNREIIEGITSVVVIILVYACFWLHNKTEAKKWQQFIHKRITTLLDQEKMFWLVSILFIIVFREAFKSILFLSSMQMQVDENSRNGIWMGALAAIIAFIVFSRFLLRFAVHIPIRILFQYSAIIIMILADYRARYTSFSGKWVDCRNQYPY